MKRLATVIILTLFSFVSSLVAQEKTTLSERAATIHQSVFTIDSHNDTPLRLIRGDFDWSQRHDSKTDRSRVDLVRMKEGGLDGAFFAVFVSQGERTPKGYSAAKAKAFAIFDALQEAIDHSPRLVELALTPDDARRIEKSGKIAAFIGMENGYPIGFDLALIDTFYQKGARYITLVHTKNNDICDSSTDEAEYDGLSPFGEEVVARMNQLGMMIDISHASDAAFYDVIALSKAPVIASHSCARALCNHPRNLDDDMLRALANHGGVIQLCILSDYVKKSPPNPQRDSARNAVRTRYRNFENLSDEEMKAGRKEWYAIDIQFPPDLATIRDAVDHIDHIVEVAGIDHVGIGTDFDGGGGLNGCYDVSEIGNITLELVRRGYAETDICKIWGDNLMRVMREVSRASNQMNP